MTNLNQHSLDPRQFALAELAQERFALRLTARLSGSAAALPHDFSERLRVARQQAVSKRKVSSLSAVASLSSSGNGATLTMGGDDLGWFNRVASALPLIALLVGLIVINNIQNDNRASEVAEVDAALLTDDLPPAAYTDPGFAQFLKSRRESGK